MITKTRCEHDPVKAQDDCGRVVWQCSRCGRFIVWVARNGRGFWRVK